MPNLEPHWTAYVGMAAGVAGLILGIINWNRVSSFKRLDLRLPLRTMISELDDLFASLPALIEKADRSRKASASADGRLNSGVMVIWTNEIETALTAVKELRQQMPVSSGETVKLSAEALENQTIEVRRILAKVIAIREKYLATLKDDLADVQRRKDTANRRT